MIYQCEEIELTLKLSYFAKIHLRELENILQIDNDRKYNQDYIFYSYIVYIVDFWLNSLFPDEQKIIFLRIRVDRYFFWWYSIEKQRTEE